MGDVLEAARPRDYLTRLAASDLGRAYKSVALAAMDCPVGGLVVDLGCGPGTELGAFALAVGSTGRVLGVDSDPEAVATASGVTSAIAQVRVLRADIHRLPLADRSTDRVHTDRVLQHAADPAAALAEAARVLRPDGVAAFAEPDWDTLVIDYPEPGASEAYRRFVTSEVVHQARIGRSLPRLCERVGLSVREVVPVTAVYRDVAEADRVLGFQRVTRRAVDAGYLTDADGTAWLDHLSREPFFASVTVFVTIAAR